LANNAARDMNLDRYTAAHNYILIRMILMCQLLSLSGQEINCYVWNV